MFPNSRLVGFGSVKRTWWSSSTSIWLFELSPTIEKRNEPTAFTSKHRSRLNLTAAASIGLPSGNLIPLRIVKTISFLFLLHFEADATWRQNCVDSANRSPLRVQSRCKVTSVVERLLWT